MAGRLPVAALRSFVGPRVAPHAHRPRCDLCGAAIPEDGHDHVAVETTGPTVAMRCACVACWTVMAHPGAGDGGRRSVPREVLTDPRHDPSAFDTLAAPVTVLYVVRHDDRVVAHYPGPAGVATAPVAPDTWSTLCGRSRLAATLESSVEGLLLIDTGAWRVGVDRCHALSARLRRAWSGFDGGPAARAELARTTSGLLHVQRPLPDIEGR